jgi:hypothetical protein
MLMELFQRLLGATRHAIALPNFDAGNEAVEISATILRECIDLGAAWPDGPNRVRLAKPFARGYLFGFSDACIQRLGMLDELDSLALITVVHGKLFGHKIGSLLVHDALRDQGNAEFGRGRTAGAEDLLRWVNDRSSTPVLLIDYLYADGEAPSPTAPSSVSPAEYDIEQTEASSRPAPPNKSAIVVQLRPRSKTVKPIER